MAIARHSAPAATEDNTCDTSYTFAVDVGSGSDRCLVVIVYAEQDSGPGSQDVSSMTYNGTAMTEAVESVAPSSASTSEEVYLWYLLNPDANSNNLVVNMGAVGQDVVIQPLVYTGVDSIGDIDSTAAADTAHSTLTLTTTKDNSLIVCGISTEVAAAGPITPDADTVEVVDDFMPTLDTLGMNWFVGERATTSISSYAVGGTQTGANAPRDHNMVALELKEVAAAGGDAPTGTFYGPLGGCFAGPI